jgi:hypothetical protein
LKFNNNLLDAEEATRIKPDVVIELGNPPLESAVITDEIA